MGGKIGGVDEKGVVGERIWDERGGGGERRGMRRMGREGGR